MAVLGVSSITPAFPRIVEDLGISNARVGMLIVAFTLPGVLLTPFLGMMADRFGRKRVLVPSLMLFGLAGGACAFTRDFSLLLALRVIQGIGAAPLGSLNLTIIGDLFTGRRRVEAMGLNASVLSIGTTSYPLIGGALASLAWNYPFLLSLTGIPIGFIVLRLLKNPEPKRQGTLIEYLTESWLYIKNPRAVAAFLAGTVAFILLYGAYLTYFALYMGDFFHASPFIIGVITSSMSLINALVSSQLGRLAKLTSVVNLVKLGFALCGLALALIIFMPDLYLLLIPTTIFGFGYASIVPSLQTYVSELAPPNLRAAFMSINSTTFRLGQTLGPPVIGLAYVYGGFQGAFFFGAGLALATLIFALAGGKLLRREAGT